MVAIAFGFEHIAGTFQFVALFFLPWLICTMPARFSYWLAWLLESDWVERHFRYGKGGSARWAGVYSLRKMGLPESFWNLNDAEIKPKKRKRGVIYLGQAMRENDPDERHVGVNDDGHLLTIATTGSGKSFSAQWPVLKTYKGPTIVFDPSGEHVIHTADFRAKIDKWTAFDPFGELDEHPEAGKHIVAYNLLCEIDPHERNAAAYVDAIAGGCVIEEGTNSNPHFPENTKIVLAGFIFWVLEKEPPEKRTLVRVREIVRGYDPEIGVVDRDRINDAITDLRGLSIGGDAPMDAATILDEAGDRERGSYFTTIVRSLKWVGDVSMAAHLSGKFYGDEERENPAFRIKDIASNGNRQTLYIVLPDNHLSRQIRWFRCLTNLTIAYIRDYKKVPETPILFVLEELPTLGRLSVIEEGIQTLRKRGVKLWCVVQHIGQLQEIYKNNWETFIAASTVQVFGVNDTKTSEWVSKRLGSYLNVRETREQTSASPTGSGRLVEDRRTLLAPDEVEKFLMKDSPFQIVFPMTGSKNPLQLHRLAADYSVPKFLPFPLA